jgi:DNA-binding transcriptional LysR family regulator
VFLVGRGYAPINHCLTADAMRTGRLIQLVPARSLPTWPVNALFTSRTRAHRIDLFTQEFAAHLEDAL